MKERKEYEGYNIICVRTGALALEADGEGVQVRDATEGAILDFVLVLCVGECECGRRPII